LENDHKLTAFQRGRLWSTQCSVYGRGVGGAWSTTTSVLGVKKQHYTFVAYLSTHSVWSELTSHNALRPKRARPNVISWLR